MEESAFSDDPIRVLIVDDSALYRLFIRDVLSGIPGCAVVGVAESGTQALEKIDALAPHLITLDVEMPGLTGIDVLREMNRRGCPAKAIMVSRFTDAGAQTTTDALLEGAFDFICKPSEKSPSANKSLLRRELISKVAACREGHRDHSFLGLDTPGASASQFETDAGTPAPSWHCAAVLIGCSTGGPEALRVLLPKLPGDFPVPVIVVQHMPKQFTRALARRLDGLCDLDVVEAEQGMPLQAGKIFVAPGGQHLKMVQSKGRIEARITDDPAENNCRPAVDYSLRSASESLDGKVLAVILTGMGRDGVRGSDLLKKSGGRIVAQAADGCTVFGMPKAIIEAGLANRIVKLPHLAKVIHHEVQRGKQRI